jgi:hypothetical protein
MCLRRGNIDSPVLRALSSCTETGHGGSSSCLVMLCTTKRAGGLAHVPIFLALSILSIQKKLQFMFLVESNNFKFDQIYEKLPRPLKPRRRRDWMLGASSSSSLFFSSCSHSFSPLISIEFPAVRGLEPPAPPSAPCLAVAKLGGMLCMHRYTLQFRPMHVCMHSQAMAWKYVLLFLRM